MGIKDCPTKKATSEEIVKFAKECKILAHDIEHEPEANYHDEGFRIHGCSFATFDGETLIYNYFTDFDEIQRIIDQTFTDIEIEIWAHFARVEHECLISSGFSLPNEYNTRDTAVALNLLEEDRLYGLKIITPEYLGYELTPFEEASSEGLDSEKFYHYACEDSIATLRLATLFKAGLKKLDMTEVFDIISPTNIILAEMEVAGINWDVESAYDLQEKLELLKSSLEVEIYSKIGRLNIASSDQLRHRLFTELKYSTKGLEKTPKGKIKTDEKNFEKLAQRYEVCEMILAYRTCEKMISSYLKPATMQAVFNDTNRVHARFGMLQKSGRTNCVDPALQTFPSGSLGGKIKFNEKLKLYLNDIKMRGPFTPPPGKAIIARDYSSLEYRTAAVAAPDKKLIEMYRHWECKSCGKTGSNQEVIKSCSECGEPVNQGKDLHQYNADIANSFKLNKTRQECKELSFLSIFYGTAWKLSNSWGINVKLAEKVLKAVFHRFSGLKKWHERTEKILRNANIKDGLGRTMTQGEVRCIFGRRRKVDINATRRAIRAKAKEEKWDNDKLERKIRGAEKNLANMLINFVAQTPACILGQIAMQKFRKKMIEKGWWMTRAAIVLFVHDEIVVEADEEIAEEVNQILMECMEQSVNIGVPVPSEGNIVYSETWPIEEQRGSYADCK